MKQLFFILLAAVCFSACSEDDTTDPQWRLDNQAAYDAVKSNTDYWTPIDQQGAPQGVYYHEVESGEGGETPLQTAKVKVYYTGYLMNDKTHIFNSGREADFSVSTVVRGFSVALQAMHVGDKWEICIPYHLGYGSTAMSTTLKGYSTLFFEVELLKITQYP